MGSSEFLGVQAERGQAVRRRVPVLEMADGSPVSLPVVLIRGQEDGPTIYLQAGLHGDEVTGIDILQRALALVDPARLRGTVVALPVAHIPAFLTKNRSFLLEERGPNDINRIFPGNPKGLMSERMAHILFHEFLLKADYCIDYHCALVGCNIAPFVYVMPDDDENGTLAARVKMAKAFGTPLAYYKSRSSKLGTSNISQSFGAQADLHKVPVIMAEMGESGRVTREFVDLGVRGTLNVLVALAMLDGQVPKVPQRRFTNIKTVHADRGGLLDLHVELGQEVKAGQVIAVVRDVFGDEIESVTSPQDGMALRLMTNTVIYPGAEVAWVVW